jgi:hypothetical protein
MILIDGKQSTKVGSLNLGYTRNVYAVYSVT